MTSHPYKKIQLTPAIAHHIRKGEHFCTRDGAWRPAGPRGRALVKLMMERIDRQVAAVLGDKWTRHVVAETVRAATQQHAEALIESLLSSYFKTPLLYGTVRRLAEQLR